MSVAIQHAICYKGKMSKKQCNLGKGVHVWDIRGWLSGDLKSK
jgi:hypothetical protein